MDPYLWGYFEGYPKGTIIAMTPTGRFVLRTPNVLKSVKDHFFCDKVLGAELEDDGGAGSAGAHFEERLFEVRLPAGSCMNEVC
jgi:hypothetical protein